MEENNSKVLDRALTLLEKLSELGQCGVNELAKECNLSPATSFRLLRTLCSHGWVRQSDDDKYSVGIRLSYIQSQRSFLAALREVAYFRMASLSESEHEAMNLVVRDLCRCYILGQSRTSKIVDYVPPVGTELPFHASACGKVLLSELPENIRSHILDRIDFRRFTDGTICDRETFVSELGKVRAEGFALDNHESQEEGFCIAVPVRSQDGGIIAALSFSGFIGQKTVSEIDRYVGLLKAASSDITKELFSFASQESAGEKDNG